MEEKHCRAEVLSGNRLLSLQVLMLLTFLSVVKVLEIGHGPLKEDVWLGYEVFIKIIFFHFLI